MQVRPPKAALRFLRWFCRHDYIEEIEGDLIEIFEDQVDNGSSNVRLKFWWQVILHLRPDFIKNSTKNHLIYSDMLIHYLKVAFRNLSRHRLYSFINLAGLTVGMTCFLLVAFYIQHQLSYDRHHPDSDRIFRIVQQQEGNTFRGSDVFAVTPRPLASAIQEQMPEVEQVVRMGIETDIFYKEDLFFSSTLLYTEASFFDIFHLNILSGEGRTALEQPNALLLSASVSEKYFGQQDPIGKSLLLNDDKEFIVRGVFEDLPPNQHFYTDVILPIENLANWDHELGHWASNSYYTYVKLADGVDHREVEKGFSIFDERVEAAYQGFPFRAEYMLQPITSIHLDPSINVENQPRTDIRYIYFMGVIALIILLMAAINYMNLATVRSAKRAKEIGVRKVMGAVRHQLIEQILGESFLLTFCSFVFALFLVRLLLPIFGNFLDVDIPFEIVGGTKILVVLLFISIAIGGLAGLYPALFISALSPVQAFRNKIMGRMSSNFSLQNVLLTTQFVAAVVLAICSVVVFQQLQFIQNRKLGFNKDQIVYVSFFGQEINQKLDNVRTRLLTNPRISNVSVSTNLMFDTNNQGIVDEWEGNDGSQTLPCYRYHVDEHFLDMYEIPLISGRDFSMLYPTDSTESFILNETAVKALSWSAEEAVGKEFSGGRVIGVVEDFHFQPMDMRIEPMYIRYRHPSNQPTDFGYVAMKTDVQDIDKTLTYIMGIFKDIAPRKLFNYNFFDESFAQLYSTERKTGQAFSIFTILALFIACLGLFGMVSYQIVQRTKEIGIRKVLGASTLRLVGWLSSDFLKLVALSTLIAFPIAFYLIQKWLHNFAYHISVKWWIFLAVSVPALLLALLTVGIQSFKAARTNPVHALKE